MRVSSHATSQEQAKLSSVHHKCAVAPTAAAIQRWAVSQRRHPPQLPSLARSPAIQASILLSLTLVASGQRQQLLARHSVAAAPRALACCCEGYGRAVAAAIGRLSNGSCRRCHRCRCHSPLAACRWAGGDPMIRQPVAADRYYAFNPAELERQLYALPGTALQAGRQPGWRLRGFIVPHGSLSDSGFEAASAYNLLADHLGDGGMQSGDSFWQGSSCQSAAAAVDVAAALAQPPELLRVLLLGTNHFTVRPAACLSRCRGEGAQLSSPMLAQGEAALALACAAASLP